MDWGAIYDYINDHGLVANLVANIPTVLAAWWLGTRINRLREAEDQDRVDFIRLTRTLSRLYYALHSYTLYMPAPGNQFYADESARASELYEEIRDHAGQLRKGALRFAAPYRNHARLHVQSRIRALTGMVPDDAPRQADYSRQFRALQRLGHRPRWWVNLRWWAYAVRLRFRRWDAIMKDKQDQ